MLRIELAGIKIQINNKYKYLRRLCQEYLCDFETPDMEITPDVREIESQHSLQPEFPKSYCEGVVTYREICRKLPLFNAVMLHSSMVEKDGKAYAICGKSGAGKSTHTSLLLKNFGDRVRVINGDKPIVRLVDNEFIAYPSAWKGKDKMGEKITAPLKALCFVIKSKENRLEEISNMDAVELLMEQFVIPKEANSVSKFLELADLMLKKCKVYKLYCNISDEAATLSFNNFMKEE